MIFAITVVREAGDSVMQLILPFYEETFWNCSRNILLKYNVEANHAICFELTVENGLVVTSGEIRMHSEDYLIHIVEEGATQDAVEMIDETTGKTKIVQNVRGLKILKTVSLKKDKK